MMRSADVPSRLPDWVVMVDSIDYGQDRFAVLESKRFSYCPFDSVYPCRLVTSLDDPRIYEDRFE